MKHDFKPQPACAATLWVKDPYWSHLKVNGRAPRTLAGLAEARADYRHRTRLAEINAMAPKLALLEAFLQPLAARGIELATREILQWTGTTFLRISPEICTRDDKLHAALLELGFREIERKAWGGDDLVQLKHGRSLVVVIDVTAPPPVVAAAPEVAAEPVVPHGWTAEENAEFLSKSAAVLVREQELKASGESTPVATQSQAEAEARNARAVSAT